MGDLLPALDRLALATAHLPGRSDGDEPGAVWYAVAAGADGSVAVALGAVRDADVATQMRRFVAGLDPADRSPAATLECLDRAARAMPALVGSAALCLTLAPAGVLRWIAAGHAPPLVVGPDGARYLGGGQVEPLGHPGRTPATEAAESLAAGTTVVLGSGGEPSPGLPTDGDEDPVVAALVPHHGLPPVALAQALTEHAGSGSRDRPRAHAVPRPRHAGTARTAAAGRPPEALGRAPRCRGVERAGGAVGGCGGGPATDAERGDHERRRACLPRVRGG